MITIKSSEDYPLISIDSKEGWKWGMSGRRYDVVGLGTTKIASLQLNMNPVEINTVSIQTLGAPPPDGLYRLSLNVVARVSFAPTETVRLADIHRLHKRLNPIWEEHERITGASGRLTTWVSTRYGYGLPETQLVMTIHGNRIVDSGMSTEELKALYEAMVTEAMKHEI
jgi:hypothetical protein